MSDTPTPAQSSSLTTQLAERYEVNAQRPFFPVNSLRLFYFLISDYLTDNNDQVRSKIGELIPKVEAVLSARTQHRNSTSDATFESDWMTCQAPLADVYAVVDTPLIRDTFQRLFSSIYPLQDDIFIHFFQAISAEQTLTAQHLLLLLQARAMDAILFSTLIGELIRVSRAEQAEQKDTPADKNILLALDWHLNTIYQINDLVDAVVFAKEDLESNSFSLFQVIRRIAPEAPAAKELIKNTLAELQMKASLFPFEKHLQDNILQFYAELMKVVIG